MEKVVLPEQFEGLVDLAAEGTGGFVVYANDDYFAGKENLLKASAPVWIDGKYTDKGKWMDGWESQRRREPGHDFAIVRLGLYGSIAGFVVDTTHFKGNAPESVSIEVLTAEPFATERQLLAAEFREVLGVTNVRADFPNVLPLSTPTGRVTHVKLRIYPDGGVARLRAYGRVLPRPSLFWRPGSLDLAAIENGGRVAGVSDAFFGPPSNLLLPGRGINMGDGWETKRRRTKGSDACILELGRPCVVRRLQLDTHFFKGNAPQETRVFGYDGRGKSEEAVRAALAAPADNFWPLVASHPIEQHRRHEIFPEVERVATHLWVHILPHGGVNRLRVEGEPVDTAKEAAWVNHLNGLDHDAFSAFAHTLCGCEANVRSLLSQRPFASARALFAAVQTASFGLDEASLLEAFAAHPRLGSKKPAESQTRASAALSSVEQAALHVGSQAVLDELETKNAAYLSKFGFVFLLSAKGKSPDQVLAALNERLDNTRQAEIDNARREQWKITVARLEAHFEALA